LRVWHIGYILYYYLTLCSTFEIKMKFKLRWNCFLTIFRYIEMLWQDVWIRIAHRLSYQWMWYLFIILLCSTVKWGTTTEGYGRRESFCIYEIFMSDCQHVSNFKSVDSGLNVIYFINITKKWWNILVS